MSEKNPLNARLRILIAKTFRAEKLYSSIRNNNQQPPNAALLSEIANDIRASVWQKVHYQLRTALNDIVGLGNTQLVADQLTALRAHFAVKAEESAAFVEKETNSLVDTAKRHEFVHSLRLSYELIRQRARAQAFQAITDELDGVLDTSARVVTGSNPPLKVESLKNEPLNRDLAKNGVEISNVIPLNRKQASGGRFR